MYFAGTLKKGGRGKAISAILWTAASTECHIESATLVAPAGHKLIVTSGLLDSAGHLSSLFLKLLCQCFVFWMC